MNCRIRGRKTAISLLAALVPLLLLYDQTSSTTVAAQRRRQSPRGPSASRPGKNTSRYANFTHKSHGKDSTDATARNLKCNSCHAIPSPAEPDRIADAKRQNIVRGYPYHDSCFGCHRKEIYRGDRPAICTVCHTRVSPRATARDVYSQFPKQIDFTLRQFPGYFPHKSHHQVILDLKKDAALKQVSCADCHKKDERTAVAMPAGGNENSFMPPAGTFRTTPSGHSSCFACHSESNDPKKPGKDNCAGCHRTQKEFAQQKRDLLPQYQPLHTLWFKDWPREWPRRVSIKFWHYRKEHSGSCTSCHTNLVETATLDIPDVPISSCVKCHNRQPPKIFDELEAEDEDSKEWRNNDLLSVKGKHACSGCHNTLVGSASPPCSHFRLDEDKYLSADFPRIAERCKE